MTDHRALPRLDGLGGLVDVELHAVELEQEVVGELDVGLVDLVDEQHGPRVGGERLPQLAPADVIPDVGDARVAELAVAQPRNGVIFVEPLQRLGGGLHVPLDERRLDCLGDLGREHRLAGAGLALDQERALQGDRGVNRDLEVCVRHIALGAFETHANSSFRAGHPRGRPSPGQGAAAPHFTGGTRKNHVLTVTGDVVMSAAKEQNNRRER